MRIPCPFPDEPAANSGLREGSNVVLLWVVYWNPSPRNSKPDKEVYGKLQGSRHSNLRVKGPVLDARVYDVGVCNNRFCVGCGTGEGYQH